MSTAYCDQVTTYWCANLQVPRDVPFAEGISTALRWIVNAARTGGIGAMSKKLADEFLDILQKNVVVLFVRKKSHLRWQWPTESFQQQGNFLCQQLSHYRNIGIYTLTGKTTTTERVYLYWYFTQNW